MKRPEGDPPDAFRDLCSGLHQDALHFAKGSVEQLAADCIKFVPVGKHAELRAYLERLLAKLTPAELKGVMNRMKTDVAFHRHGSEAFLKAVLNALSRSP